MIIQKGRSKRYGSCQTVQPVGEEDPLFIGIADGNPEGNGIGISGDTQVVVMGDRGLVDFILPFGLGISQQSLGIFIGSISLSEKVPELIGRKHIHRFRFVCYRDKTVVVYFQRSSLLSRLGGDDDHPVGSPRSVDGRSGSIFENCKGLYVGRMNGTQRVTHPRNSVVIDRHAVDNEQGIVAGRKGGPPADADGSPFAGSTPAVGDLDPGNLPGNKLLR